MLKNLLSLVGFFFVFSPIQAQVYGVVSDGTGAPLSFASVYIQGTSQGTTTNIEGEYELPLAPGTYQLVFQYVGYEQRVEQVKLGTEPLELNVVLREETYQLDEIVVRADAEDPAYAVIRKAIAKRKYYRDLVEAYSADVYIKGNIKFLDAPERFMGQEIGDMMGSLDSNRQGIIYLSESQSKLYFQEPDRMKEEVEYTKVSGNDNGFGFNSASAMDFNLYENYSLLGRQIISPIASNALSYYDYQLEGTLFDKDGRLINKIRLIPKRSEDPVYRGHVYIVEGLWLIQSAELLILKGAMKQPGLDSLWIRQVHVPVNKPDVWRIFSQSIRLQAGLFGFKVGGNFSAVYSDYDLDPDFPEGFFDNEVYKVEEGANDKSLTYWDSIRPIPLTRQESIDYVRKDSLQELRNSKPYLDSVDRVNNRFRFFDLFAGYEYNNSYQNRSLSVGSPLTTLQFNTVQGFNADLNITYRQEYGDLGLRWLELRPTINYGFSDNRLRGTLGFTYRFNQVDRAQLTLEGGVDAGQFNREAPISKTLNTLYSLFGRRNYMKIYDRSFGRAQYQQELVNGVFLRTYLDYARRSPLVNRSGYAFSDFAGREYDSNDPRDPENFAPSFEETQALEWGLSLRLRYKQKYISYPDRKFIQGSALPDFLIDYRKGIKGLGSDVQYDQLSLRLQEDYLPAGVWGYLRFRVEGGTFLNRDSLQFMDFQHFNGNQTIFGNPERYLNSFMLLPYYERSTTANFLQAHLAHHFDGFLLDKIPGLRRLGLSSVLAASYLYTADRGSYLEINFGLDNLGFGPLRLFRIDAVASYVPSGKWDFGMMIGLKLP